MKDLSLNELGFEASSIIRVLQRELNSAEFGLRIQGLFAHALIRLGAHIIDIRHSDHPDLIVDLGRKKWQVEVEVLGSLVYRVKADDLKSIRPRGSEWYGFLSLLDCGPPLSWLLLRYETLSQFNDTVHIARLRIFSDSLSLECTDLFASLIIENKRRLRNLSFPLLKEWALAGQGI